MRVRNIPAALPTQVPTETTGKPVAAVVPIEDLEALAAATNAEDAAACAEAMAAWAAEGRPPGATLEELAARWGIRLDPDAA